ncbi:hypothetical protein RDWZM_004331 [Blomia tropicalis]|uniref:Uncharacterized protein n=1 Tax=Blomia tropicalis TaxID=40697 RepID=A0A9Q0RTE7_BLOTA|nr:hypothetical protein RDWZM_004331 [Blomia tropicalis]
MRIVQIQAYWYILIITTTTPTNILCDYYIAREENKIPDTQNPYQYDNYGNQEESEDYSILIIVFVIVIIIAGYFFFCPMTVNKNPIGLKKPNFLKKSPEKRKYIQINNVPNQTNTKNPMRTMTTTMTSPQPIPSQTQGLSFTPVQNTTTTDGKNLTNNSTNIAIVSNENVETSGKLNKASPYSEIGQPQKPPEINSNLFDRSTVGSETNVIKTVNS